MKLLGGQSSGTKSVDLHLDAGELVVKDEDLDVIGPAYGYMSLGLPTNGNVHPNGGNVPLFNWTVEINRGNGVTFNSALGFTLAGNRHWRLSLECRTIGLSFDFFSTIFWVENGQTAKYDNGNTLNVTGWYGSNTTQNRSILDVITTDPITVRPYSSTSQGNQVFEAGASWITVEQIRS